MARFKFLPTLRAAMLMLIALASSTVFANNYLDLVIDGMSYRLNFKSYDSNGIPKDVTAEVRALPSGKYSGFVSIPPSVTWTDTWAIFSNGIMDYVTFTRVCPVTEVGVCAFQDCTGLTGVSIPNSVKVIGNSAFYRCTGLTNVVIPNSVTELVYQAFSGCTSLSHVTIGNSVTTIGNAVFANCKKLTEVTLPNSLIDIGGGAFSGCSGLEQLTIGNSVKNIYSSAFSDCSALTSVTIPASVTYLGTYVFAGCTSLTSVTCLPETPPQGADGYTFKNLFDQITLSVPEGSLYVYQTTFPWKYFYKIVPVERDYSISLDEKSVVLEKGDFVVLHATVTPDDDYTPSVTWSSSNSSVASVDAMGYVTAEGVGDATITAQVGDASASCHVKVVSHTVTLDQTLVSIPVFSTVQLHAEVTPHDGYEPPVTWSSSRPGVAAVTQDGLVKGYMTGTAVITAKAGQSSATCTVTVTEATILAEDLILNAYEKEMLVGDNFTLTATVLPSNVTNGAVSWTLPRNDGPISCTVNGNKCIIVAKKMGTATIYARTTDGTNIVKACTVTVGQSAVIATSITLNKSSLRMYPGDTEQLVATVLPENTTNKRVNWSTSNSSVATVVNGNVTAVRKGTATITATTTDGSNLSVSCKVTVLDNNPNPKPGDVNSDGNVDIEDLTLLISYVLNGEGDINLENADLNGDGEVNIEDVMELINKLGLGDDYVPGDVNGDSNLDIEDLTTLITYVLTGEGDIYLINAELTGDGEIDIEDIIKLIDIILNS